MVLGFLGNVAGNLNQDAFQQGTIDELNLQKLQRAEQNRLNREAFREKQGGPPPLPTPEALNQGMAGLNIDRFGGTYIDIPPPMVDQEGGVGQGLPLPDDKQKPIVKTPDADGDGMIQKDGSIATTPDITIDKKDLTFPDVDPNKIDLPPALGGQYNAIRQKEIDNRKMIDDQTAAIMKNFGIRRKGGQGTQNVTRDQGDAYKFFTSDEYKNFIYQHPEFLTEVSEDPIGFFKKYTAEKTDRTTNQVIGVTTKRTDKLIDGRLSSIDNDEILFSKNSAKVVELANDMGIDPIAALAIFGIESDFGRVNKGSGRSAFGSMQVTTAQFNNLKKWFTDPANRAAIESAFTLGGKVNKAQVDYVIQKVSKMKRAGGRSTPAGSEGEIVAGLAQLIYNKAIGLDKNLWGAGYQANADKVKAAGSPLAVDDGNITNSDYNRAYVSLYNHIYSKYGKQLLDKYGNLSTIDLNTIAGSGVGQPILNQAANTQTTTSSAATNNQAAGQTSTTTNQTAGQTSTLPSAMTGSGGTTSSAGLKIEDAQTDTTGQSTNTGNTGVASGDVSSLQIQSGVDTGGTKTEEIVPKANEKVEPPAFYQSDPSKLGFDLRNYLEERELIINQTNKNVQILAQRSDYFRRLAEVSRIGGTDEDSYNQLLNQSTELMAKAQTMQQAGALEAKKAENKIMYLQGMQGLQDLANGSVNRAAAVWSEYSGMAVRINPRSDGKYDITLNGKPYKTMDFKQLSNTLQLAFDQGYRKTQQEASTTRQLKLFENQLEIAKENQKAYNDRQKAILQGRIDIIKDQAKTDSTVKLQEIEGVAYVQRGDSFFIMEVFEYEDNNGDTQVGYREVPVTPPSGSTSSNAYKRK